MKKIIVILFLLISFFPNKVFANSDFNLKEVNMKIEFSNTWYVFTRENLEDNEKIDYLGIDKSYLKNFFSENNAYLDGILYKLDNSYLEIFVRVIDFDQLDGSLSKYKYDYYDFQDINQTDYEKMALSFAETRNVDKYEQYESSNAKYFVLNYKYEGNFNQEYVTVVNGSAYVITMNSNINFVESDKNAFRSIIDTIEFKRIPNSSDIKYLIIGSIFILLIVAIAFYLTLKSRIWRRKYEKKQ